MKKILLVFSFLIAASLAGRAQTVQCQTTNGQWGPCPLNASVQLLSASAATATASATAQKVYNFSLAGNLITTYAGITGSPVGCTLQMKSGDSLGNLINNGSAISTTPANGTTSIVFTPAATQQSGDEVSVTYACGTYPTAGTISLEFVSATTNSIAYIAGFPVITSANGLLKVGIAGGASGATIDAAPGTTAPTNGLLSGGVFNTSLPTLSNGQFGAIQLDSSGRLITNCGAGCTPSTADESNFTQGTSVYQPVGGFFNNATTPLTSGQGGAVQMTADRSMYQNLNRVGGALMNLFATLFNAQSATATATSNAIRIPMMSNNGILSLTGTGITGTPSGCQVALENQQNLGSPTSAAFITVTFTPSNSYQYFTVAPTAPNTSADELIAVYTCGTYPTAGTISATFNPFTPVTVVSPLPSGGNTIGAVNQGAGPWTENVTQIAGIAIATSASGEQKVGIAGGTGASLDAAAGATAASNSIQSGCVFNSSAPTPASGQQEPCQIDGSGNLKVNVVSGSTGNAAAGNTGSAVPTQADYQGLNVGGTMRGETGVNPTGTVYAAQTDITSVGGTTVVTAVAGELKVGIAGNAGASLDFSAAQNQAPSSNALLFGCEFNTTPTTLTNGNASPCQLDNAANLLVDVKTALPTGANTIGKIDILGNAGATLDSTVVPGAAPTNALVVGAQYNTTQPAPTAAQTLALQSDQVGNLLTISGVQVKAGTAWNSATTINTLQYPTGTTTIGAPLGMNAVVVQLDQTTTLTGGAVTFQGTYDGTNWVTIPVAQVLNPSTYAQLTNPYTFVASTNQPFLLLLQGYQQVRLNLTTVITGTGSVTPEWSIPNAASLTAVNGTLSNNGAAAGANRVGVLAGVVQTTPANGSAYTQGRDVAPNVDTGGTLWVSQQPALRPASYHASANFAASSTTDNACIYGNGTDTILLYRVDVDGVQTTAGSVNVQLIRRSAAETGGTSANMTVVKDDTTNYGAANSTPVSYTGTGPTVGTPVGNIDNRYTGFLATSTASAVDLYWWDGSLKPQLLIGTGQGICVNIGGALTGGTMNTTFYWEEIANIAE